MLLLDRFNINASSGKIQLVGLLDFETRSEYSFLVFATDKAVVPKESQALVRIQVLDYNDVGPEFTLPIYTAVVTETSTQFQSEVRVTVSRLVLLCYVLFCFRNQKLIQ